MGSFQDRTITSPSRLDHHRRGKSPVTRGFLANPEWPALGKKYIHKGWGGSGLGQGMGPISIASGLALKLLLARTRAQTRAQLKNPTKTGPRLVGCIKWGLWHLHPRWKKTEQGHKNASSIYLARSTDPPPIVRLYGTILRL